MFLLFVVALFPRLLVTKARSSRRTRRLPSQVGTHRRVAAACDVSSASSVSSVVKLLRTSDGGFNQPIRLIGRHKHFIRVVESEGF